MTLAETLNCIYETGYIHCNIILNNIVVEPTFSEADTTLMNSNLVGFSFSCHVDDARVLGDKHADQFGPLIKHVPREVATGQKVASFSTDTDLFAAVLREIETCY